MMARTYYTRLKRGTITYDVIPARYQAQVKEYAREDVAKGIMPVVEYEMLFDEPYEESEV